jgi:hypothetical protein
MISQRDAARHAEIKAKIDKQIEKENERHKAQVAGDDEYHARNILKLEQRKQGLTRSEQNYALESPEDASRRHLKQDRRTHFENVRLDLTGKRQDKKAVQCKAYNYYKLYRNLAKRFKNSDYPSQGIQVSVVELAKAVGCSAKTIKRGLARLRPKWLRTAERGGAGGPSHYLFPRYPMQPTELDEAEALGPVDDSQRGQHSGSAENAA